MERGQRASRQGSSLWSCVVSVLAVLLLTNHAAALEQLQHLSDTSDFLQLSPDPQKTLLLESQSSPDTTEQQRLKQLLTVKDSLIKLLFPHPGLSSDAESEDVSNVEDADVDYNGELEPPADKRVFCNGFTGCGGRFRAQRRRDLLNKDNRVVCNSKGCFNGGTKRAMSEAIAYDDNASDGRNVDMGLWRQALQRLKKMQLKVRRRPKRPFCNNYGCQNMGRIHTRASGFRSASKKGLPRLDFLGNRLHNQEKRYLFGGYDEQVDAISDSLNR
ncbi:hypothetical protein PoB_006740000 [Plakobranchus ocellatus]|uniref:Uncharacterized protein n=1 Tax=Plakobranchus ocellatus TaxID=259542 RepID=A0AAV4DA25_9GAST|nr:hypothetical protein PoB_006740000 [Plakobranchus ocellatus]